MVSSFVFSKNFPIITWQRAGRQREQTIYPNGQKISHLKKVEMETAIFVPVYLNPFFNWNYANLTSSRPALSVGKLDILREAARKRLLP